MLHRVLFRDVECRYCLKSACPLEHQRCLAGVAPDEIVAAVDTLLPDVAAPPSRPRMAPGVAASMDAA